MWIIDCQKHHFVNVKYNSQQMRMNNYTLRIFLRNNQKISLLTHSVISNWMPQPPEGAVFSEKPLKLRTILNIMDLNPISCKFPLYYSLVNILCIILQFTFSLRLCVLQLHIALKFVFKIVDSHNWKFSLKYLWNSKKRFTFVKS